MPSRHVVGAPAARAGNGSRLAGAGKVTQAPPRAPLRGVESVADDSVPLALMSLFESTLPCGEPELMRVSSFRRYLADINRRGPEPGATTRLSSLSPSLLEDLLRFENRERGADVLEVLAACVRHGRALTAHLQCGDRVLPLTAFPRERLAYCPVDLQAMIEAQPIDLPVLQVETAVLRALGDREAELIGEPQFYRPLSPLLWALALHGTRDDLLPEVAGTAVYRVSPAFDLTLSADETLRELLRRMRRSVSSLREIAEWPGLDRSKAARLINALYLQSGLIVSRSHPAALGDSWFGPPTTP